MLLAEHERDLALTEWRRAEGPALVACQSRYNAMQDLIDFTTKQPINFGAE